MEKQVGTINTTNAVICYFLMGFGWVLGGLGYVAALLFSIVEHANHKGKDKLLEDHFLYIKRTCWYGLLWTVLSIILLLVVVGYFTAMVTIVWVIYRSIKGFTSLQKGKFMYPQPEEDLEPIEHIQ